MSSAIKKNLPLICVLASITAFGPLSIDMYLPAFPKISQDFNASMANVEMTLAAFFAGLALGQIIYGPISDKYGRKKPLYFGLLLYFVSSIFCALTKDINSLILFRFMQSLGACAGMVISRAVVRDIFEPKDSAKVFSTLMLIMGVAPILAPLVGSAITQYLDWHWLFYIQATLCLLSLIGIHYYLRETREYAPEYRLRNVVKNYIGIFKDRNFVGYALAGSFTQAGLYAYLTGSPFVFIEYFGIPSKYYSLIFGVNVCSFIISSQFNARFVEKFSIPKILKTVYLFLIFVCCALVLGGLNSKHILFVSIPLFFYIGSLGFVLPNTTAQAMANQSKNAGSASALIGTLQFSIAAISSGTISYLQAKNAMVMTTTMAVFGMLGIISFYFFIIFKLPHINGGR